MLPHLETSLLQNLSNAEEVFIAVALMKSYGLNAIEEAMPENCSRKYLVGIHLPTPPDILRKILKLQENNPGKVFAKVHNSEQNYHPKVYIIKKKDGELIAFIGSANATYGGFNKNVEMNVAITNQVDCTNLQIWFDNIFRAGSFYNEDYISRYEIAYKRNRSLAATQASNIDQLNTATSVNANNLIVSSGQFFRQSDFDAFALPTQLDTSGAAVDRRAVVKERLIELSNRIHNSFPDHGILNLHRPARRNNYTSQHFHSRGNDNIPKQALWLNYGKSPNELSAYTGNFHNKFVNHQRIQVILLNNANTSYIGIWLYIAKHRSSYFDRKKLKDSLKQSDFVKLLYEYVLDLGGAYWIALNDDELWISEISSPVQLVDFLQQDDFTQEFIIGRNYNPNDSAISDENIAETALSEFAKLYKIYDLIKANP